MWSSASCDAGIGISPVVMEMKNLTKGLKGLSGEFQGRPAVESSSVYLAGLSAEDRERHLLGFCKLTLGHYEELPMGYQRLVDDYLGEERGGNLMAWYLTGHTSWKSARYELHRPGLLLQMTEPIEFADRGGRLSYSHSTACLCMAFFVRSLSDPSSEVLSKSLVDHLSALNILPDDILELAGKRGMTDGM